ncbi:DEAD/DEAH box helicase [Hymenobacter sediminis]|uniref:DEAD/DEAH box helicase n=1 Tax=Hymenobacter sediminis TaxID=2218621 RepID=UPI000DA6B742|nr:DEAD/DEAH box helicase family protein [Hymenobacter sediminis]RPD44140.1 DEAD/DEAH box helicase [Hymenobacter sediminis]
MYLQLPELRTTIISVPKSKNTVTKLVSKASLLKEVSAVEHLKGLLVSSKERSVYITDKAKDIPEDQEYVAHCEKLPTMAAFNNQELVIKKWLKSPNGFNSPGEVATSWRGKLSFLEEDRDAGINGLRQPQIGALYCILGHLKLATEAGVVVLPTGTGKTETMLASLVANQCQRLLVVVPSDALRTQISEKFITLGLLKEFKVLADDTAYPAVGVIRNGFASAEEFKLFVANSNVVVATMAILKNLSGENLEHLAAECSHVFIDEAHHVKAKSWEYVKQHFDNKKIIQFTATPFRNDGQRLEGKVLFNFPLREAQSQGYYKKIEFLAVSVPKLKEADKVIADTAIARLRADLKQHNHILMARCATKERADEIFKLYEQEKDLQPVLLYSGAPQAKENYQKILKKQARIIVCVDMLGEGFDLPELKIAAFHDIRKSLPITLQLAGRFTRTKFDEELGDACFIANIADPNVTDELEDLYARNPDWNKLLANMSHGRIEEEVDFKKLLAGFPKFADAPLPLNNIKIKMSAVAYQNKTDTWNPRNFKKGLPDYEKAFYKFDDLNSEEQLLIIITADQSGVEWLEAKEVYQLTWRIIVVYWETRNNLLFIHSSDNSSLYEDLAAAVTDNGAQLIKGMDVFKTFDGMHRILLQNVGLRNWVGKDLQFRMMMGRDLEQAISMIEKQKGEKAFVMGTGYENGKKRSHGASYKGRIWMKRDNDLSVFRKWCKKIGGQLLDPKIDPNKFLKETLIPTTIDKFPKSIAPVWIDWHEKLYDERETYYKFTLGKETVDLSALAIEIGDDATETALTFSIATDTQETIFQFAFVSGKRGNDTFSDYQITRLSGPDVLVSYGKSSLSGIDFFKRYPPTFRLADGASVSGNDYLQIKHPIGTFDKSAIEAWSWTGVDTSKESQRVEPRKDSVQYHVIQQLLKQDYDYIYDDDGSGEMADIVTLKVLADRIQVELYHLKYAKKGKVSKGVGNFYEVCGQAQRSTHWKHKSGDALILHLLRRNPKTEGGIKRDRLEKGDLLELEGLKLQAKRQLPLEFSIIVVQPSLSKAGAPEEILKLLGVTQNFAQELAGASFRVIGSK